MSDKEPSHVTDAQLGGGDEPERKRRPRRAKELVVLELVEDREQADVVLTNAPPPARTQCKDGPRPCGYVRCKWHLWHVPREDRSGRYRESMTDTIEPWTLETCGADHADRENSANQIGALIGQTGRRIQQIVRLALIKLRAGGVDVVELKQWW